MAYNQVSRISHNTNEMAGRIVQRAGIPTVSRTSHNTNEMAQRIMKKTDISPRPVAHCSENTNDMANRVKAGRTEPTDVMAADLNRTYKLPDGSSISARRPQAAAGLGTKRPAVRRPLHAFRPEYRHNDHH